VIISSQKKGKKQKKHYDIQKAFDLKKKISQVFVTQKTKITFIQDPVFRFFFTVPGLDVYLFEFQHEFNVLGFLSY